MDRIKFRCVLVAKRCGWIDFVDTEIIESYLAEKSKQPQEMLVPNIHFRIITIWFGFGLFLIAISNLPHQSVSIFSWINVSLYSLLFLQSLYLFFQTQSNKFIFLNTALFAVLTCIDFTSIFIGQTYLFGTNDLALYFYEYLTIALNFSFTLCIVYICINYLFRNLKPAHIYLISLSIILPILIWHFYPALLDKNYIIEQEALFDKSVLYFNFLPLFFLIFYGILLYKYDKSLGEHINAIMVCLFIMTIIEIPNMLEYVYHIMIFQLTQYMLLVTLSFFLITMFKLLNHSYSAFGQFYDSILVESKNLGVPIKRKKSSGVLVLDFARAYFRQRRNDITFGTLFFIFFINYSREYLELFEKYKKGERWPQGYVELLEQLRALYPAKIKS